MRRRNVFTDSPEQWRAKTMGRKKAETAAVDIFTAVDSQVIRSAVGTVLAQGGAVMFGQTRDNAKLIVTVYLDGDKEQEYCDDLEDVTKFLGSYQV